MKNEKGRKKIADFSRVRFVAIDDYREGTVEIAFGDSRDKTKERDAKVRAGKSTFEMEVSIKPDLVFKDCYFVLLFSSNGALATYYDNIGTLLPNSRNRIKIKMPAQVDAIGSLHVFEKGSEIRSNQSVPGQSLEEEHAALVRNSKAIPTTILHKTSRDYPHILSKDGKYLATFRDDNTHYRLVVINTADLEIEHSIEIGEFDEYIEDLQWLNNKEVLYVYDSDLYSLDVTTGQKRMVVKSIIDLITCSKDGIHAFVTRAIHSFLYIKIDCRDGKPVSTDPFSSYDHYYTDREDRVRLRRKYDAAKFTYLLRRLENGRWFRLDDINKEEGLYFSYGARDEIFQSLFFNKFSDDPNEMYVFSNTKRDTLGLYTYNLSTGKIGKTIWEDDRYDVGGPDISESYVRTRKSGEIIGLSYWRDKYQTIWFDKRFESAQSIVESALPELQHRPISWNDDASTMVFYSFSGKHPGSYYLLNLNTKSFRKILDRNPELSKRSLSEKKTLVVKCRDGHEVLCYLTLPLEWDGEPAPLIVNPHGGPMVRDYLRYSASDHFFSSRGFAVLKVNYRGSAGFGKQHIRSGLIGNLDTLPIDDIADATRHLINEGIADPDRVSIMGGSWGGYSVYMCIIRYPELYQCGIASAAPTDMKLSLSNDAVIGNKYAHAYWDVILREKIEDPNYVTAMSPLTHADKIKRPILIIHGEKDWRVRPAHAKQMAKALERNGVEHQLILYPEDGHGHSEFGHNNFLNEAEVFLRKTLDL